MRGHVGGIRGAVLATAVVAALGAVAAPVRAQTDEELDRARQAFAEGVEASDAGRWDEAVARFREVMEVRATPQVKYNLAVALEQTGEYVEAEDLLRDVVQAEDIDDRTRDEAETLLASVAPQAEEQRAEQEAAAAAVPTPEETAQQSVLDEELLAEPEEDEGGSIFGEWWFWTGVGAVVVGAVLIGVLVASGGDEDPVRGNLEPGILRVNP